MKQVPQAYFSSNDGKALLFFGDGPMIRCETGNALQELDDFLQVNCGAYLVSFLAYDLKNEIEPLQSDNPDGLGFPDLFCWNPAYVVAFEKDEEPVFCKENPMRGRKISLPIFLQNLDRLFRLCRK